MEDECLVEAARLALVGRLARGVVHELNNPLFVVLGLVELVHRDLDPASKAHERLGLALETGGEIKGLLAVVGALARGDGDGESTVVPLQEPAREAVELARRLTLAKEVQLVERYPAEPLPVLGRPVQLRQLFLTLLALAQQAAVGPTTVSIELASAGAESVARLAADVPGPADASFELAAAAAIARLHGGSLVVSLEDGLRAELRLPLAT